MKKSSWGWVGIISGILAIGGKVVATSSFVQDIATRVSGLEKARQEDKDDVKYIRNRVDDIYNRLPPCGQCKDH